MKFSIRLLYLYLFSFIGLLIMVIGCVRLVQLGIKVFIFAGADAMPYYVMPTPVTIDGKTANPSKEEQDAQKKANEEENTRQRQREVAESVAMILVGTPLYLYHWLTIKKE